ncbi:MAG TPA: signal recognition particle protein [Pseudomonadaceae bacterium]|nr:signal recognition particle protein [Pseudomonadaceae bacterium]
MFESLTERLNQTLQAISGKARLTEDNIQESLREVRRALLEADVALEVVKSFVERVKERALGQEVSSSLSPGQVFIKIVQAELQHMMGDANEELDLRAAPPAIVLMAGLQGAGKTTTVAKLALWLRNNQQKKSLLVSADVYRPAAIRQLETLAAEVGAEFFPSDVSQKPEDIVRAAIAEAKKRFVDVLFIDTAGRLAIDAEMMAEIKALHAVAKPVETLFVVDAMTGQDAANTAKAFNDALPLTGVILTKTDGDARGGAALSVRQLTGKPIKFLGVGERPEGLEPFHPDRLASRILGMGDVLSLIEDVEKKVDKAKAEKLASKIKKGERFDLQDFKEQLEQMRNLGGITNLLDKMPGMGGMAKQAAEAAGDKNFVRMEAIINSMTRKERRNPDLLNGSRKRRITQGSGTTLQDLNRLIKQHKQMQKMMKKMKGGGMANMMRGLGGKMPPGGGMPPGGRFPGM